MRQPHLLLAGAGAALFLTACGGGDSAAPDALPAPAGTATTALSIHPAPSLPVATAVPATGLFDCRNQSIGAVEIDSVRVPSGAACVLEGTGLIGSILVEPGAVLDARSVRVRGNLQADGAAAVLVAGNSAITGSVQLKQGGAASIINAHIGGDLQFTAQHGALLAQGNRITGSLQAVDNLGGITLNQNLINGNLQCKQNRPAPTGSGNRAASLEDQCANLVPATAPPAPVPPTPPVTPPPSLPPLVNLPAGGTVTCRDASLGAVAIDTVVVPANAGCTLAGTRLIGSLLIEPGARADARDVTIGGNLQAERAARHAQQLEPQSGAHAVRVHAILLAAAKNSEAAAFAKRWRADHPRDPLMRLHLAELALRAKEYRTAFGLYQEAVTIAPNHPIALNNLAWVAGELGDARAVGYAERALKLAPNSANVLHTMGALLVKQGDAKQGLTYIQRARSIDPKRAEFQLSHAKALIALGRKDEARKELEVLAQRQEPFMGKETVATLLKSL